MAASPDHITAPTNAQVPALGQMRMGEVEGKDQAQSVPSGSFLSVVVVDWRWLPLRNQKNWLLRA
jgi:hypothetical protein